MYCRLASLAMYYDPTLKHRGEVGSPLQGFASASLCAGLSLRVIDFVESEICERSAAIQG